MFYDFLSLYTKRTKPIYTASEIDAGEKKKEYLTLSSFVNFISSTFYSHYQIINLHTVNPKNVESAENVSLLHYPLIFHFLHNILIM